MKRHVPNLLTCMNLFTGATGCIVTLGDEKELAIIFVLISGIFDFLDGLVARWLKVSSAIGKELDSLADMVSFGLLPSFYISEQLRLSPLGIEFSFLPYAGLFVAVFSALRLAKFNLDERQTQEFIGLPTPANAIMVTSIATLPIDFSPWLWIVLVVISCILLVSPLRLIAFKFSGWTWKAQKWICTYLVVVLALIAWKGYLAVSLAIPIYIFISLIKNLTNERRV